MTREELWRNIAAAPSRAALRELPLTMAGYYHDPLIVRFYAALCRNMSRWNFIAFDSAAHMTGAVSSAEIDVLLTHWHGDKSTGRDAPLELCARLRVERRERRRIGPGIVATMNQYERRFYDVDSKTGTATPNAGYATLMASFDAVTFIPFALDALWNVMFMAVGAAADDFTAPSPR
jgi:hypothetical protein